MNFCWGDDLLDTTQGLDILGVRGIGGSEPKKIVGNWLVPVSALLKDPKLLGMHEGARQLLLGMAAEVIPVATL